MIKTTIIIILILLLLITLYSYYCLSSGVVNFERARLEYILQKESEIAIKEKNIKVISDCSNKNEQLLEALNNINIILEKLGINNSNIINDKNNNIVKEIENIITHPEQIYKSNINNIIEQKINTKIISEVPIEHLQY